MENLIVGGTGTLGHALVDRLGPKNCVVFSRDELKQAEMKKRYPGLKTILGDIRNYHSIEDAVRRIEPSKIFHVAALKHVDVLEEFATEAIETNIQGTINSANAALNNGVAKYYFTSTDKAVLPINVYGMSKALAEKFLLSKNHEDHHLTSFYVMRWGNILGSRGSVVSQFAKSLKKQRSVSLTDPRMTRFWMKIEDAVDFMLSDKLNPLDINLPEMKAASVMSLIEAIALVLGVKRYEVKNCGIRPGEKIHECIYSDHDKCIRSDTAPQWTVPELKELVKPILEDL